MKKSLSALLLAVLVLAAACTLFKKDINISEEFDLEINQPADAPSTSISVTEEVSTANDEIQKYKDQLDQFNIDRITFRVKQFQGTNAPKITGTLKFALAGTNNFKTLGNFTNLDLKALSGTTTEVDVLNATDGGAAKNELINALKAGNNIILKIEGNTTENPIVTTLTIKIYTILTVEV